MSLQLKWLPLDKSTSSPQLIGKEEMLGYFQQKKLLHKMFFVKLIITTLSVSSERK